MSQIVKKGDIETEISSPRDGSVSDDGERKSLRYRIREIVWDSLDR
jgi:hypothetical protein